MLYYYHNPNSGEQNADWLNREREPNRTSWGSYQEVTQQKGNVPSLLVRPRTFDVRQPHRVDNGWASGGTMQVGDLVTCPHDRTFIGIIFSQIGVVDRWFVQWNEGTVMCHNGSELEVI